MTRPSTALAVTLATLLAATYLSASAATTPAPSATPRQVIIHIKLPAEKLHTEYLVEVNKQGQVVRVKSGKLCKVLTFNTQTYGNALQMWIRKPDGSAIVGLFRVSYDYDPKSKEVSRNIALVSQGGTWGDQPGAANVMIETAKKEAAAAQAAAAKRAQEQSSKLPTLNQITGKSPAPSPSPRP